MHVFPQKQDRIHFPKKGKTTGEQGGKQRDESNGVRVNVPLHGMYDFATATGALEQIKDPATVLVPRKPPFGEMPRNQSLSTRPKAPRFSMLQGPCDPAVTLAGTPNPPRGGPVPDTLRPFQTTHPPGYAVDRTILHTFWCSCSNIQQSPQTSHPHQLPVYAPAPRPHSPARARRPRALLSSLRGASNKYTQYFPGSYTTCTCTKYIATVTPPFFAPGPNYVRRYDREVRTVPRCTVPRWTDTRCTHARGGNKSTPASSTHTVVSRHRIPRRRLNGFGACTTYPNLPPSKGQARKYRVASC